MISSVNETIKRYQQIKQNNNSANEINASINGCAHSTALLWIIYVEFSTYTSFNYTNLNLQQLIKYYETKEYVGMIS